MRASELPSPERIDSFMLGGRVCYQGSLMTATQRLLGLRRLLVRRRLALSAVLMSLTTPGAAAVFQTDAAQTPLPQPVGLDELNLASSFGYRSDTPSIHDPVTGELLATPILYGEYYSPPDFPQFVDGDLFTLAGLFKWRGEQIDPIADAQVGLGHFSPGCGFKAELVLHGGGCGAALGWYNFVTGAAPSASDIQPLVPAASTYLGTLDLVPRGWDNRDPYDLSKILWTPQAFSSGAISANAKYTGGDVAFALTGSAATQCPATKFSVGEHNAKNGNGVPWVTALTYRSTVDPSAIYLAFEDLPMSTLDWRESGGMYKNDGDFNDAVFFISGLGACPEPACQNVVCDVDQTCSGGVCVGGHDGAPSEGGATNANAGAADALATAGDATTSLGGTRSGGSHEQAGEASDMTGRGTHPSGGDADDASGGDANANGGRANSPLATSKGCGCRLGSQQAAPERWLGLALASALVLRRRRSSAGPSA